MDKFLQELRLTKRQKNGPLQSRGRIKSSQFSRGERMRYEARLRRGGRCRVRAHYIGIYEQTRNPCERKRAMRKRIDTGLTYLICSF